jgi:hypothetical protein
MALPSSASINGPRRALKKSAVAEMAVAVLRSVIPCVRVRRALTPEDQDSRHGVIILEWSERVLTSQGRCPVTGLVVSHVHTQP